MLITFTEPALPFARLAHSDRTSSLSFHHEPCPIPSAFLHDQDVTPDDLQTPKYSTPDNMPASMLNLKFKVSPPPSRLLLHARLSRH